MNYNLIIEPINIDDVINNPTKYNTSNHWPNNVKPDDYEKVSEMNYTKNWISMFKNEYITFTVDNPYEIDWMKKAHQISRQTKKFSKLFEDELDEFVKNNSLLITTKNIPYFVRCENVSLKYGEHGVGPYYSLKQIIQSAVSSSDGHTPIDGLTKELRFYLIPFCNKINNSNEFRVFVCNNKITCISQQALYNTFVTEVNGVNINNILERYVNIIVKNFEEDIKKKIIWSTSYSYDIAVIKSSENDEEYKPYFIEPNPFGKEYSSGSSLFHWLNDEEKLYGNVNNNIYLRYTYKNI